MWVAVFGESLIAHLFPADVYVGLRRPCLSGRRIIGGVGLFVVLLSFGNLVLARTRAVAMESRHHRHAAMRHTVAFLAFANSLASRFLTPQA